MQTSYNGGLGRNLLQDHPQWVVLLLTIRRKQIFCELIRFDKDDDEESFRFWKFDLLKDVYLVTKENEDGVKVVHMTWLLNVL